jgi:branched-chain amino acid transport system ATP-binding protein
MALEVKNLESWYGESHILHGVNFAVRDGEVVTLLGRNGAGRSTILKTILGLTSKRTGSVEVYGAQTISMPTYKIARLGVGYCPEERGIFAILSAEENLLLNEITEGLAPVIVQKLGEVVTSLRNKGFIIVLVEQNFRFAAHLADRHYVVEYGNVVEVVNQNELVEKAALLNEYLGV